MGRTASILLPLLFLIFFAKISFVDSSYNSRCIESEWQALMQFKASISNVNISRLSSWIGRDCCSWYGITCHNLTHRVQSLYLGDEDTHLFPFNSPFSPWLFNLTHLEVLSLGSSGLKGPIPNMFEKLTSLTYLDLSYNSFDYGIFPESLCSLTSLTYIDLFASKLQGSLPSCLANLTSLTELWLADNDLRGEIPGWLNYLTHLTNLHLGWNSFSSINPSSFGHLSLHNIQLIGTIPSNLTKLEYLNIDSNFLTIELSEFFFEGLASLERLYIGENPYIVFNVSPQWIPPFQLLYLSLDYIVTHFQFPSWLQTQRNLVYLSMSNASISTIPDWFPSAFPNLTDLRLSGNLLTGSILTMCQSVLPNLTYLDLSNNLLTGSIPDQCLTAFPNIYAIDLSNNSLNGRILKKPSAFPNLNVLLLSRNLLTGSVLTMCQSVLPNLTYLDLSNNLLTGSITDQCLTAFPNINIIDLSNNSLNGRILKKLCNLKSLAFLSLANNQLSGKIPSCLGSLRFLGVLNLANNNLSGPIPHEIGSLRNLSSLHLNGNKLSGMLSLSFQNWASITTVDLGDNELQGSIPQWVGKNWSTLQYLRLESNHFSGKIPVNLCQLPSLQILNLALNNLVGTIPRCIGNLPMMLSDKSGSQKLASMDKLLNIIKGVEMYYVASSLQYAKFISLSGNCLYGEIPVELMNLKGLQSLNLSNNELTGIIPENINNLKQLESLDLSMNQLSGKIPQSLADIDDLSYLNLSFNNLAGKVPSGAHFETLDDPSIYQRNIELCGKMLMKSCPEDDPATYNQPNAVGDDQFDQLSWFYAGIGPGFAVGFLGVMCIIYFKDPWRIAYFGFVDNVYNKVWVTSTIKFSQFRRMFN